MNNANDALTRIFNWVRAHAPQTLAQLNPPASHTDIQAVETALGLPLPDAFKTLLNVFDGEDGETWLAILGDGHQLLSCQQIIEQYRLAQEFGAREVEPEMETVAFWKDRIENNVIFVKGAVKPLLLAPRWVPFTSMNGDIIRYFDFDPAPGGTLGQVIEVDAEGCSYQVLASSFEDWLHRYADDLEAGRYQVDEEGFIESIEPPDEMDWGMPEWLQAELS
jgi:cell wall assembly regulator SMI1